MTMVVPLWHMDVTRSTSGECAFLKVRAPLHCGPTDTEVRCTVVSNSERELLNFALSTHLKSANMHSNVPSTRSRHLQDIQPSIDKFVCFISFAFFWQGALRLQSFVSPSVKTRSTSTSSSPMRNAHVMLSLLRRRQRFPSPLPTPEPEAEVTHRERIWSEDSISTAVLVHGDSWDISGGSKRYLMSGQPFAWFIEYSSWCLRGSHAVRSTASGWLMTRHEKHNVENVLFRLTVISNAPGSSAPCVA